MTRPLCIATWNYTKPTKKGHQGLKAKLKYVTFREDSNHRVPADGHERWFDCGLGTSWREVYQNCQQLAGPYVFVHQFVISPDPDLMALVPADERRDLLAEPTVQTIQDWHQARDLPLPEMSFVIHDRETTDKTAPGRQMLHTHVFCAGTLPTLEGRQSVMVKERDVVRNRGGLERPTNLNHIVEQNWEGLLDRALGRAWRLTRELKHELPEPVVEQENPVPDMAVKAPTLELDR